MPSTVPQQPSAPSAAVPGLSMRWLTFPSLGAMDVYRLAALRQDVFIVEQASIYNDLDGKDPACWHLLMHEGDVLAGCLRACGAMGDQPAFIGRIVVAPSHRGRQLGRALVAEGLRFMAERFPGQPIRIGAQSHLQDFYGSFGFVAEGPEYDDSGIPHVTMWLRAEAEDR